MLAGLPVVFRFVVDCNCDPHSRLACGTGSVQCCNSVEKVRNYRFRRSYSPSCPANIGLSSVNVLIGAGCSPITAVGVGGTSCSSKAVCCENNSFHGLIALGCVPVNVSL
ncbi:fungal hydrophobin [Pleurotus eryngii]|uniref:Hydrophobin n=1 Tax=Pleurotus eryngii TaxID=5323 RepID=A0A9P6D313_PLEER|nr:fungal hydrophobin [Pleurotus eryngii]